MQLSSDAETKADLQGVCVLPDGRCTLMATNKPTWEDAACEDTGPEAGLHTFFLTVIRSRINGL